MKIELDKWEIATLCFEHFKSIEFWAIHKDEKDWEEQKGYHRKKWREFQEHKKRYTKDGGKE